MKLNIEAEVKKDKAHLNIHKKKLHLLLFLMDEFSKLYDLQLANSVARRQSIAPFHWFFDSSLSSLCIIHFIRLCFQFIGFKASGSEGICAELIALASWLRWVLLLDTGKPNYLENWYFCFFINALKYRARSYTYPISTVLHRTRLQSSQY